MAKRILVIYGHPLRDSFSSALGAAYVEGARSVGADVREVFVHELAFDPVLHQRRPEETRAFPWLKRIAEAPHKFF